MSLPADYHMHTPLCRHAVGEPVEYAAQALRVGLDEIGMSDHCPMIRDDWDDWHMRSSELDEYVEKVERARAAHPGLRIKLALEVDYLPGHEDWIRELAGRQPWDYFIGSVHYVSDGFDVDNPSKLHEWRARDPFEVWTIYFERLTKAAESGLFNIIGHPDLPKKFRFYPKQDCSPLFGRFARAAAASGTAIEINTAGLRKQCGEMYPSLPFLKLAKEAGVALTFGSDSHAPEEVGMNFPEAVELARTAGYTHCCRFTRRERTAVPL